VVSVDNLRVFCNLAKAYALRSEQSKSDEYEIAIRYANHIIAACEAGVSIFNEGDYDETLDDWRVLAADWNQKAKHYDEAEKFYTLVLVKQPNNYAVTRLLLHMMREQERYAEVVAYCQKMEQEVDGACTRLSAFLHAWTQQDEDSIPKLFHAFNLAGELATVKQHYQTAVNDAAKPKNEHTVITLYIYGLLMFNWAAMLHQHAADQAEADRAVALWEELLAMEGSADALWWVKNRSSKRLSSIYLARAIEAGRETSEAIDTVSKIEALGNFDTDEDVWAISKNLVRSLLGRYYSAVGDLEQARTALRPSVEVGVKLLSDEDPENDYLGFQRLGLAFMDFGDVENSIAAWTMIGPTHGVEQFEESKSENAVNGDEVNGAVEDTEIEGAKSDRSAEVSGTNHAVDVAGSKTDGNAADFANESAPRPGLRRSNTSQLVRKLAGPLGYRCDGRCGIAWTWADDMYHCRICMDVQFCKSCLEKVQSGEITNICSPKHNFMHVPEWDTAGIDRIRQGQVLVGEKLVPLQDWLQGIKEAWGFPLEEEKEDGEKVAAAKVVRAAA
jgi:tetratricopeptide (TPR) repeat protein